MTARLALSAIFCTFALPAAFAQTAETPKQTEAPKAPEARKPPETPPDVKAFSDILKETDNEKKVAALEKWKLQFPESNVRSAADSAILSALAKLPKQEDRTRKQAASMYKSADEKEKGPVASAIAGTLLSNNVLLKDAKGYAKKGVDSLKLSKYTQEQAAVAEKRKLKPPSPEDVKKRFDSLRASRLAVLGRIEVRLGHIAKGKKLLEESNSGDASNVIVQAELGVLAAKAGDDKKAIDYLIPAKLSGRPTKEAAEAFEAVYKKQHNGSTDGLDAMLDGEYHKRYPNPVKVEAFQPTAKRSDRVVLAEVFTGSGCPPCAAADVAFDAAMERYSRKDVAVIMYHVHVPAPDPMTNAQTQALYKDYTVAGVPTFLIDGEKNIGGGSREMAKGVYDKFRPLIEKDLETPAEAHISAGAFAKGKVVSVNARVFGVKSESKDLKVEIALVEKELRYSGENGIRFHPMVVRSIKTFPVSGEQYQAAFDLDEVSKASKEHLDDYESKGHRGSPFKFSEKKYQIDPNHLAVVIFVHDSKTKHVLQAGFVDLSTETSHPTLEANNAR